jgi:hypothetical protein
MQELATMMRTATQAAARAPLVADESKKWLQWDEFLGFVQALRAECAGAAGAQSATSRSAAGSKWKITHVRIRCMCLPCMHWVSTASSHML